MTTYPVVATPLNTRTVREVQNLPSLTWREEQPGESMMQDGRARRDRLVADPAFVVLPKVPDLTCRTCEGRGTMLDTLMPGVCVDIDGQWWHDPFDPKCGRCKKGDPCESCGGSGVSPVYAATWQWRKTLGGTATAWNDGTAPHSTAVWVECRQLVEWRARRVEPLPVVDLAAYRGQSSYTYIWWTADRIDVVTDKTRRIVTDEPWAQNLRPGMCVLRLSEWEHLEQPYTEMWVECDGEASPCDEGICIQKRCGMAVPLSVPDGVLSWVELA